MKSYSNKAGMKNCNVSPAENPNYNFKAGMVKDIKVNEVKVSKGSAPKWDKSSMNEAKIKSK